MPRIEEFPTPAVRIKRTGQIVLLLEWVRNKHDRWQGHVAWMIHHAGWRGVDIWLPGDDLEPIEGENYKRVLRHHAHDYPF
ncbi:MAG: hypothetical protein ACRDS0_17680 [Pseudonocardiaceae bacterium]